MDQEARAATTVAVGTGYAVGNNVRLVGGAFKSGPAVFQVVSIGAVSAVVNAGGTGYVDGDIVELVGGVFGQAARFSVLETGGIVDTVAVEPETQGSYTTTPVDPVSTTAITGTGINLTLDLTFGAVSLLSLTDGGIYITAPSSPVSTTGGGSSLTLRVTFGPFFAGGSAEGTIRNDGREITGPRTITTRTGQVGNRIDVGTVPRAISGGTQITPN